MNILITNDDGIHAPGINTLYETLKNSFNVTVVAPLEERSTTGHTLTLDHPLRLVEVGEGRYGCSGYPADCTIMGQVQVLKQKPDVVISGINKGANLGQDVYYSGTVAAAREAAFRGIPAISVSTDIDYRIHEGQIHFQSAADFILKVLQSGIVDLIEPLQLVNINVPNLETSAIQGVDVCRLGFRRYSEEVDERFDFKDRRYYWIGGRYEGHVSIPESDCDSVNEHKISLTALNLLEGHSDRSSKWKDFAEQIWPL